MAPPFVSGEAADIPLHGELRYGWELARLVVDGDFRRPGRRARAAPVLLIPGFLAGDPSLAVLAGWLRRRGSLPTAAGIRLNVGCAERAVRSIEERVRRLAEHTGRRVVVIGQSRGGTLARVVAVRHPDAVGTLVMLGSPVLDQLSVGPTVLSAVRSVARLGDLGVPGFFSSQCRDGQCCACFRDDLRAPLPDAICAVAIYSRTDGVVSWKACLDSCAEQVEVDSSHSGMSVNREVYRVLAEILDQHEDREAERWTG